MTGERGKFTYSGGFDHLVRARETQGKYARPYEGVEGVLRAALAEGLEAVLARQIPQDVAPPGPHLMSAAAKLEELRAEFAGQSEALALHGLVIATSRRTDPPDEARDTFRSFWTDHHAFLLRALPKRWLYSALMSFKVFGWTEAQRISATELSVFFNTIKLYENERLHSTRAPDQPFQTLQSASQRLPYGLTRFSLLKGDLDKNLLADLWKSAEADPVLRRLACPLLIDVNRDTGGIFRRLRRMRKRRRRMASKSED
ncbi:hypothetical protein [Poseidonocella sedimentorum]|uniref:Uncharacterized protein n=1 Tax=Poseidonocella sedimentorum TaxID=871652 RepID=A0A1I6EJI5_9RHOB|nr:hypothetical protein [Poseidonocella sedimentorum]SFR17924.1 hypothetical protein SAMN04515673_11318 [Poseidonocella sedimentorum]